MREKEKTSNDWDLNPPEETIDTFEFEDSDKVSE